MVFGMFVLDNQPTFYRFHGFSRQEIGVFIDETSKLPHRIEK